jgi:ABC-type molybdate transport system permease subunit
LDLFTVLEVSALLLLPLVVTPSVGGGCFLRAAAADSLLAGVKGQMTGPVKKVQPTCRR